MKKIKRLLIWFMTLTTLVMEMPLGEHEKSLIGAYGQASITNKFSL
nr:hypothetical protein [Mycoplasmopsis bovis]